MGALIPTKELEYIRSLYPLLQVPTFTCQQEQMVMLYMRGATKAAAAKAVGFVDSYQWNKFFKSEGVETVIQYLRDKEFSDIRVTRESITAMLLEAHSKAANTTEEVKAIDSLAKLHNLYPAANKGGGGGTQVNVNLGKGGELESMEVKNGKQIERMSDEQLVLIAEDALAEAVLPPKVIEGRVIHDE